MAKANIKKAKIKVKGGAKSKPKKIDYQACYEKAKRLYGESLGSGCSRAAFRISKAHVIKVPLNAWGVKDNKWESELCVDPKYIEKLGMARCKLVYNRKIGATVLRMQYVKPVRRATNKHPAWCHDLDGWQFGYTVGKGKARRLVAYDYADQRDGYWIARNRYERRSGSICPGDWLYDSYS